MGDVQASEPLFVIDDEQEITPAAAPAVRVRPSNPARQAVAGLFDVPTSIPTLAGLASAGLQAPVDTIYDYFAKDQPTSLMDNFTQRLMSSTAFNTGVGLREKTNELLGIEEPASVEDQAARFIPSAITPIPGSLAATAGGKALLMATPGVATGPGFLSRAGVQLGLTAGIDQGMRAVLDDPSLPLALSDQAIHGEEVLADHFVVDEVPMYEVEDVAEPDNKLFIELDTQMEKRQWKYDVAEFALGAATLYGLYKGARYAGRRAHEARQAGGSLNRADRYLADVYESDAHRYPGLLAEQTTELGKDTAAYADGGLLDAHKSLASQAKRQALPDDIINRMVNSSHADPQGMAQSVWDNGLFPGSDIRLTATGRQLRNDYIALTPDEQELFDSIPEIARRLFTSPTASGPEIAHAQAIAQQEFNRVMASPAVRELARKMRGNYSNYLGYLVESELITPPMAQTFINKFRLGGEVYYFPVMRSHPTTLIDDMVKFFGVDTQSGKELDFVKNLWARGDESGDAAPLMNTIDSFEVYNRLMMEHVARSRFQNTALQVLGRRRHMGDGNFQRLGDLPARDDKYALRVVGTKDVDDVANENVRWLKDDPRFGDVPPTAKQQQDIMWMHHKDELVGLYVPHPHMKEAMHLSPRLGPINQFFNNWKQMMTRFTVGHYSLFAPISSAFSAQQVAINTVPQVFNQLRGQRVPKLPAMKQAIGAGFKSEAESVRGVAKLMKETFARDLSDFFSAQVSARSNLYSAMPQQLERAARKMEGVYSRSVMNHITRETGRVNTSLASNEFTAPIHQLFKNKSYFTGKFGHDAGLLLHRLWRSWNNSFHEGPAYAAMLKKIGDADLTNMSPKQRRLLMIQATDEAKNLAGDMRRVGGSAFAKAFNASVPFSGAMLQSWASIGRAFLANPPAFMAGAAALIGFPTASEMLFNNSLGDDQTFPDEMGKEWTYRDYYWNGFTASQRADNFIVFVPGRPPWEPILIPFSPEWSLFRSVVIEGMDALFGFSQIGDSGLTGVNDDHVIDSLGRVLDVPLPPPVAATLSHLGVDARVGVNPVVPDQPGEGSVSIGLLGIPTGRGERLTRGMGATQYANQSLDKDTVAVLQDLFGSAASLYVAVREAVHAGSSEEHGSLERSMSLGIEALGDGLAKQARYVSPLWQSAVVHPSTNNERTRELLRKRRALDQFSKDAQIYLTQGRLTVGGLPLPGSSVIPSDDPIVAIIAESADAINQNIKLADTEISNLRALLTSVGNTGRYEGQELTIAERNSKIDALKTEINHVKALQLASLLRREQELSAIVSQRLGREVEVELGETKPRENLGPGSVFQAPR